MGVIDLLKNLLVAFKNHGHTAGVPVVGSLAQTSIIEIDAILESINKELDVNSDGIIINHNFRHN